MKNAPMLGYAEATTAWEWHSAEGPTLRGRRSDGDGPTLHFIHGSGFCGGVYWPFLRSFMPDYGLFCHDIEGHGHSDARPRYSGGAVAARRVATIVRDQRLEHGTLIGMGHSYGGALTLRVAAENPGLFRALVLLDPILMPPAHWLGVKLLSALHRNPMANAALRRRSQWASREQVIERLRGRGVYRNWREDALASFAEHATREHDGQRILCCPTRIEADVFSNPIYPWPSLKRVQTPILMLFGRHSYGFLKTSARLAQRASRTVDIQDFAGGHCFMLEQPEAAAQRVREWLARQKL